MRFITKPIASALIVCLIHNPIAGFYLWTGLLFFKPFPAFADAFLDQAAEGQTFGTDLMTGYSIPSVNSSTGEMTLTNGAVAGQKVQQNELFQEIQPGSMDGISASYGDAATFGTHVNNDLGSLTTGTSTHAYAYQTLMGANTSMPNIVNDPIWKTSDDIYSLKSPLINDLFNGCEKKTSFSETSCPIHLEDLKTCKKTLKTEKCSVTRSVLYRPVMSFAGGDGNVTSCGIGCAYINVGAIGDNYWSGGCTHYNWSASFTILRPEAIKKVTVVRVIYDDQTRIFANENPVFTGGSGWGGNCELKRSWDESPGTDITAVFKNAVAGGTVVIRQETIVGGNGEGYSLIKVEADPDITEQFIDNPAGCRQNMFNAWPVDGTAPGFVSTGSLNDQASTDWWACTDASNSRVTGSVTLTTQDWAQYLSPILPDPPATPPAPICYSAETRVPGHITLPCFTDKDGYQVCPEYDYNLDEHNSCDELTSNPQCKYVSETCADGAVSPITGTCQEFIITYDCGTDSPANCDQVNDGEKTICDSGIRCMGGECVDQKTESNKDFIRAATALQTLNQAQQSNGCNPSTGDCALFAGEPMECQMADLSILGQVDCCNMPIQGSWIDYMWLATNTWELADTSVEAYSIVQNGAVLTDMVGAWNMVSTGSVLQAPIGVITDTWSAVTEPFTSMYDSVASMLGEEIGTNLGIEAAKQQVVQWMGEWVASVFGETAASTLLAATSTTVGTVTTTTYSMAGSMLSSIITVVGIIYAIYQIAKMVVQLIFACTEEEVKLNMLKQQRLCTSASEIGNYCSSKTLFGCAARKEAYCCFSSPFSRIFQQQARPQLGITFGDPKAPTCEGLSINKISQLDFDKMDFSEWIDMMKISNQLPEGSLTAGSMYDKANVTKGKLPNTQNTNAQDRLNTQTQDSDIDAIRQHLLDNL
ncbi:MAG: conjugal transfer protein TraN [Methylococcaceae bacterium]|nr:conjugal transfer protein TraN [Methylococcaceae bacterium]